MINRKAGLFKDVCSTNILSLLRHVGARPYHSNGVIISLNLGITVVLPIENKMSQPETMTTPFGIINVGLSLLFLFYLAMGFLGYLRFGQDSLASITLNLPHDPLYGRYLLSR